MISIPMNLSTIRKPRTHSDSRLLSKRLRGILTVSAFHSACSLFLNVPMVATLVLAGMRAYAVKKVVLGLSHSVIEAHKQQVSLTP